MNTKLLYWVLTLTLSSNSFAQTPEQVRILKEIDQKIEASKKAIAIDVAKTTVADFFTDRLGYIHQTNAHCIETVNHIIRKLEKLKTPLLFKKTYSSSQQAYEAIDALGKIIIHENTVFQEAFQLLEEYSLQKANLNSTAIFLSYDEGRVRQRFPIPSNIKDVASYYKALWDEYQKVVQNISPQMKYFISKCGKSSLDINQSIAIRKDTYQKFYSDLLSYLSVAYREEIAQDILSNYQPSESVSLGLTITSVLKSLDRMYRTAILVKSDYFQAISIIDSYESISTMLLSRIIPIGLNKLVREEAKREIQRSIDRAHQFRKTLKKRKPSYYLQKKLAKTRDKISRGDLFCPHSCSEKLKNVEMLIGASQIFEDVSTENIYSLLGYQILDSLP